MREKREEKRPGKGICAEGTENTEDKEKREAE